jgi:hypothetical protein
MANVLSPIGGAAAQFFNNNGIPVSGGLIYTYAAGTNTPAATYTTQNGTIANSNPIVLDASGRPPQEIWLAQNQSYKFILTDANNNQIWSFDSIIGINATFNSYIAQEQAITATAGQTIVNMTTMSYLVGTGSLIVFVNGLKKISGVDYTETTNTSITFTSGLSAGAVVDMTTTVPSTTNAVAASNVSYNESGANATNQTVQSKLQQYISVKDFGAKGDGITDDSAAIRSAISSITPSGGEIFFPSGSYIVTAALGDTSNTAIYVPSFVRIVGASQSGTLIIPGANNTVCFRFIGLNGGIENLQINNPNSYTNVSGIRLAPIDETQTTTHTDTEFNEVTNVSIRYCQEGITLKCGPTVGSQDSYCYYNSFTNIDIRNTVIGFWLKIPNGGSGSGCNRNRFINCRVGETGSNTGLQIDAGDTNSFVACSFEGINSGISPSLTPTAIVVAYNSTTYASNRNKFYGLTIEGCTLAFNNSSDILELYGYFDATNTYTTPNGYPLAVNMTDGYISGLFLGTNRKPTMAGDFYSPTSQSIVQAKSNAGLAEIRVDGSGNYQYFSSYSAGSAQWHLGNNATGISKITVFDGSMAGRFVIDVSTGNIYPYADNVSSCGLALNRWSVVYAATGTINTSDARQKTIIGSLNAAEQAVAKTIKGLFKTFKFNSAIVKKGAGARIHVGVSAQDVQAAFIAQGLDPNSYGLFCSDTWYEVNGKVQDNNGDYYTANSPNAVSVTQLGIRYEELLAFVISAM